MADLVSVQVQGLAELEAKLESVPLKIARAILRRAVKAGGEIFRAEMQARVNRLTGFLAAHIGIRLSTRGLSGTARVGPQVINYPIRPSKRPGRGRTITAASVGRFLEFGTRKMAKRPFIRQAFETKKEQALDVFVREAKAGFDEGAR
jgi:HK97 gp10 family phage protein